ncbi:flagellar protein FliT [Dyella sedimenti]|jgi:hypothetical protein|uniref:flagellar protein FliT n=1 Tax=Dyella sedimenti TaxID=2919947 RepID=UPI001FA99468|nr:flagellar protein FliT [Dyella sedimenti]
MNAQAAPGILEVSARMLASAHAGEWLEVAALDQERRRLLAGLPMSEAATADTLGVLLSHNEELRTLAEDARAKARDALDQHHQRHRALSTYLHVGID